MRILCAMSSPEYLRYYDETIVQLASHGHDVIVAVNGVREGKPVRLSAIAGVDARVSVSGLIPARDDVWTPLARAVRGTMDFIRYLHPQLAGASALRARVRRQALPWPLAPLDRVPTLAPDQVGRRMARLARLERAVPVSPRLCEFLDAHAPDLVLVSPLVEPASDQVDLVRAAQARGIRVATLVASWDNLTNKGDLRVPTARVFVWNEQQKREAVDLHRVDPAAVVVTGSQVFDRWFNRTPSLDRQAFCRQVGLPDDRPFVLYTGSSIFIARAEREMPFVRQWIAALRASDEAVRRLAVLVRPHPYNGRAWDPTVFDELPGVAVWPRGGYDPIDARNREGFFDSMFHAEAVVGLNTSAMIESAIVGRPVLSITPPEFAATQGETLHFRHLLPENGGFLRVASSLDEHVAQLSAVLHNPEATRAELESFVHSFIRPHGLDCAATPHLVAAIEEYGRTAAPPRVVPTFADRMLSLALLPAALVARFFPPAAARKRGLYRRVGERLGQLRRETREMVHEGVSPARAAARSLTRTAPPLRACAARRRPAVCRQAVEAVAPYGTPGAVSRGHAGEADARRAALLMRTITIAATVPLLMATALTVVFAAMDRAGRPLFSYPRPANVAEAAGQGMAAETLRLLRAGQDPQAIYDVRGEIISSSVTRVTALEAAIWSRRIQLIKLLDREGAIPASRRAYLACLASALGTADIVAYLAPQDTNGSCDPDSVYRAIEARGAAGER